MVSREPAHDHESAGGGRDVWDFYDPDYSDEAKHNPKDFVYEEVRRRDRGRASSPKLAASTVRKF